MCEVNGRNQRLRGKKPIQDYWTIGEKRTRRHGDIKRLSCKETRTPFGKDYTVADFAKRMKKRPKDFETRNRVPGDKKRLRDNSS